jgi:hypothetical protein
MDSQGNPTPFSVTLNSFQGPFHTPLRRSNF